MKTIGVLGLGSIGMRHAGNILDLGLSVLGYDPDQERQKIFLDKGGVLAESEDALFSSSDAVVVCTPNRFHHANLKKAIQSRRPVLMEKPVSHTLEGLEGLIADARKHNVLVAPAMNLRFHAAVRAARSLLLSGQYGRVLWARFICSSYLPKWRPHQDYRDNYTADPQTGGVLFDIIHEFDVAYFLLGPMQVKDACVRNDVLDMDADQVADVLLEHDSGVKSSLHVDYVSSHKVQRYFEIHLEHAYIKGDLLARSLEIWRDNALVEEQKFDGDFSGDYVEEMTMFLAAARNDGDYVCGAEEACDVLSVVLQAREKAKLPKVA